MSPDDLLSFYHTARQVAWRYRLDMAERESLENAMRAIQRSTREIMERRFRGTTDWQSMRDEEVLNELRSLSAGIQSQIHNGIVDNASQAGHDSVRYHNTSASLNGKLRGVNFVAISPEQFKSFFERTPLGGRHLDEWIGRAFERSVIGRIKDELNAGLLQGKGYRGLVNSIMQHMGDFSRRDAMTIARTYTQTANVEAHRAVMNANSDIIKGWRWSAVLEQGNPLTGRGTCLACALNDGIVYPLNEGPEIPKHPNCRCVQITITKSFRELGIDIDELEDVARPYTMRTDMPVGEGGRRISDVGWHKGSYSDWLSTRSAEFQQNILGSRRYEMFKSGVPLSDFIDPRSGRLLRIGQRSFDPIVSGGRAVSSGLPHTTLGTFASPSGSVFGGWNGNVSALSPSQLKSHEFMKSVFQDAPEDIRRIAHQRVRPPDIEFSPDRQSSHLQGLIKHGTKGDIKWEAISFRHEYGHFLDYSNGSTFVPSRTATQVSRTPRFNAALKADRSRFAAPPPAATQRPPLSQQLKRAGLTTKDLQNMVGHHLDADLAALQKADPARYKKILTETSNILWAAENRDYETVQRSLFRLSAYGEHSAGVNARVKYMNRDAGLIQDSMAALSDGRVGSGHTLDYWKRPGSANHELFSHHFALRAGGDGSKFFLRIFEMMAPDFSARATEVLNVLGR